MSHHYNNLKSIQSQLKSLMSECWQEGRKYVTDNPDKSEPYFIVGDTCKELIYILQEKLNEEVEIYENK